MAVSILMTAVVTVYYKMRRLIAKQHFDFVEYVRTLTVEQTAHLEECIHKIPAHPENITPVPVPPGPPGPAEPAIQDSTIVL